jgi:hypothetical protein
MPAFGYPPNFCEAEVTVPQSCRAHQGHGSHRQHRHAGFYQNRKCRQTRPGNLSPACPSKKRRNASCVKIAQVHSSNGLSIRRRSRTSLPTLAAARLRGFGGLDGASQKHFVILVHRLLNPFGFAAGRLAVFQGASEAPIPPHFCLLLVWPFRSRRKNGAGRAERATRKNSQPAAAQGVALKMGRRPRCSS